MQILRDQTTSTNNLLEHFTKIGRPTQPPLPQAEMISIVRSFDLTNPIRRGKTTFRRLTLTWTIGQIFEIVQCNEEQKVTFVTHMLKNKVTNWWRGIQSHLINQ